MEEGAEEEVGATLVDVEANKPVALDKNLSNQPDHQLVMQQCGTVAPEITGPMKSSKKPTSHCKRP